MSLVRKSNSMNRSSCFFKPSGLQNRKGILVALEIIVAAGLIALGIYLAHQQGYGIVSFALIGGCGGSLLLGFVIVTVKCFGTPPLKQVSGDPGNITFDREKKNQHSNRDQADPDSSNPSQPKTENTSNTDTSEKNQTIEPDSNSPNSSQPKTEKELKTESVPTLENTTSSSPCVRSTVYVANKKTGAIYGDGCFEFSKKLKDENKSPIQVSPKDIYLRILGTTSDGEPLDEYFPSSLFKNVKEGWNEYQDGLSRTPFSDALDEGPYPEFLRNEIFKKADDESKVRFYKDDQLYEFTCKQSTTKDFHSNWAPFEWIVQILRLYNEINEVPLFMEDIEHLPHFMGYPTGEKFERIFTSSENLIVNSGLTSMDEFLDDQKKFGVYKPLQIHELKNNAIIFSVSLGDGVLKHKYGAPYCRPSISDFHFFLSQTVTNETQLWIFIKHKPEAIKYPDGTHRVKSTETITINSKLEACRDPRVENIATDTTLTNRPNLYAYGQYIMIPLTCPLEDIRPCI